MNSSRLFTLIVQMFLLVLLSGCSFFASIDGSAQSVSAVGDDYGKTTLDSPLVMAADGTSAMTVIVHLVNNDNTPIVNFTPTYAVYPSGGVSAGACSASDVNGDSTCVVTSTTAETKSFTLTNAKIGLSRNLKFILSQVSLDSVSLPSTPILSRVISGATWPLTGACDPARGGVWVGGNGIGTALSNSPTYSTPCNADGTFSVVINRTCGAAPCLNGYSPEVQVFQNGGLYSTTRLYQFAPTVVTTAAGLQAALVDGSNVALGADIDLSTIANWTPVDASTMGARLFGDGHTLDHLTINAGAASDVGLFKAGAGFLFIDSVNFTNASVTSTGDNVGGVIGNANHSHLFRVSFSGTVSGSNSVGGLIGYQNNGSNAFLKDCTVAGTVTASDSQVGGLVGWGFDVGATRNHVTANVSGQDFAGGLIGRASATLGAAPWDDSAVTGTITCSAAGCKAGGLVGSLAGTSAKHSKLSRDYFSGSVMAPVSGVTNTLAGSVNAYVDITQSFYLQTQICQQCTLGQGSPLSASQMTHASSFTGWDFTTPLWTNAVDGVTMPQPKR